MGIALGTMGRGTIGDAATIGPTPTMGGTGVATHTEAGPLKVGQSFGPRYHIIKLLGAGGMGAVYQAWDAELGVAVALKVIRTSKRRVSAELEKRFKNELLLARSVTHKNVVRIHDLGEIENTKYITMSFIQGHDLSTLLRSDGKFSIARSLALARQIAAGLEAAHEAGVVHRDLKPANIMIGADDLALIMDFGISASAEEATTGGVVGTLEYMAPEQGTGQAVDGRADIYAFGLILYELLTGPRLTASVTPQMRIEAMKYRTTAGMPPIRSVDPSLPAALETVVTRCIERDPAARFQTTAEVVAALAALNDDGELIPIARRLTRQLVAGALALFVTGLGVTWWLARGPAPKVERPPVSVLIADVENRTGDKVFEGAIEETLARAIEGASFINVYSRDTAAKLAQKLRPGAGLDEETGRLVARSEGIHVLMTGTIGRQGTGYVISVRAIDPSADAAQKKPLAVVTASATTKEMALRTVGTLGARIRGPLGDTVPESARLAAAETFTTSSVDAVKTYTLAQDLLFAGRTAEAFDAYTKAIEQDPSFGRAYSGAGIAAQRLGRDGDAQELWKKAISLMDRMTEREKYRTLGGYYLNVARNYQKAIENFSTLVNAYPADRAGHASLALAYFWALNISKALEEEKRALDLDPKSILARVNYALYAMYAGDFDTAAKETQQVIDQQPALDLAYVPLATAALARGDSAGAVEAYAAMAHAGTSGASLAATGVADVALYEGRYGDVERILRPAIAEDEKNGNAVGVSTKWIVLAEAYEGQGKTTAAIAAARRALKLTEGQPLQVLAAAVLIRTGQDRDVKTTAAAFSRQLEPQSRAYGKILDGRSALKARRLVEAVDAFTAAQKLADLWMARFDLGVAYVEAGHFAEGLAELERCQKRRGEATAIFLDEVPTFRYLATLPYWLARAQDGVGQKAAATAGFDAFLRLRSAISNDPLVVDARRRLSVR
jgi:tetratricopeptide (TPR) repeat protein/tRNA A-37 threonylcarbamoyl transferase component Bud32